MKKVIFTLMASIIATSTVFAEVGTTQPPCRQQGKGDRHVASKAVVHSTASKEAKGVK